MVSRILSIMIMGGRTCRTCWVSSGRSTTYLLGFLVLASKENLSLQYVNSKSWTFRLGFGENQGFDVGVAPRVHCISECSRVGHLQHGRSHDSMVFSGCSFIKFSRIDECEASYGRVC